MRLQGTLVILPAEVVAEVMDGIDDAAFAPDGNTFAIMRSVLVEHSWSIRRSRSIQVRGWMSILDSLQRVTKLPFSNTH